ncbi:MAG: murein biosynthesis integral membrane protein MurJ [Patescibacteria group bacterium]|jgi:putative peptidoglycan lipid II flippase
MIKKILNGEINSITLAAAMVAFFSLVSRLLGIFRDRILASEFGAGDTLDIYYAAFRVPDLIFNLLVLGALSAGFIPVFTSLLKHGKKDERREKFLEKKQNGNEKKDGNAEAWLLASNILNLLAVSLIILSAIGIIAAPFLTRLITPGFSGEKLALTVSLTRIMFLSPIFLGVSSVLGGILQSFRRFFIYSLAPVFYNVGIILGALFLTPFFGVHGLAWGVTLGALLHMLVQWPSVRSLGFRYRFILDWKEKNLRKIMRMMGPRTMSLAITQINLVVLTIIASTLKSGSLTVFNLANNLQSFPVGIFGISYAVAVFPTLAREAFHREKLVESFSLAARQIIFFIIPSAVLLLTLRAQIVRVILGSGHFDWEDTIMTIDTLAFFTIGLLAQALMPLLVRVFYARHDSRTPFYIGLFSVAMNTGLCLWLPKIMSCRVMFSPFGGVSACLPLGVAGLALAFSISSTINFILLWIYLRMETGKLDEKRILVSTLKIILASVACGLSVQGLKLVVWPFIDMDTFLGVAFQGLFSGLGGIAVFLLFCRLLQSEEFFAFWNSFKRRLPWSKLETEDKGEARGI